MSDGSVQLRLFPALDSSVSHYLVVVVPDELAQNKRPEDFTVDQVCLMLLGRSKLAKVVLN